MRLLLLFIGLAICKSYYVNDVVVTVVAFAAPGNFFRLIHVFNIWFLSNTHIMFTHTQASVTQRHCRCCDARDAKEGVFFCGGGGYRNIPAEFFFL